MNAHEDEVATSGQIWIPPRSNVESGLENPILLEYFYGQPITINFEDTFYFTASNLVTFTPSLPTGSFGGKTCLGPYYANSEENFVIFTAYDEEENITYVYGITVTAPPETSPE